MERTKLEITSSIISGSEHKRLVMGYSEMARPINIGSNWTRLRVGLRFSSEPTGSYTTSSLTGFPKFWVGLLANPLFDNNRGLENGPLTYTSNWLGVRTNEATWTYSGAPLRYTSELIVLNRVAEINHTGSLGVINYGNLILPITSSYRMPLLVDFTRSGSTFIVQPAYSSTTIFDASDLTLWAAMAEPNLSASAAMFGNGMSAKITQSIVVDEITNGEFNSLCIAWSRTSAHIYISEVLWSHFET